jgi:hypothetical protein
MWKGKRHNPDDISSVSKLWNAALKAILSVAAPSRATSHVRMEAKRRALDEIATRQRAAEEKRREEAEALGDAPYRPMRDGQPN